MESNIRNLTRLVKKVNTLQRVASVGITSAGNRNKKCNL